MQLTRTCFVIPLLTCLSVSSVGSEAMQPAPAPAGNGRGARPFSILGRIGGDATSVWADGGLGPVELSVSSVGSEAMQLVGLVRSLLGR